MLLKAFSRKLVIFVCIKKQKQRITQSLISTLAQETVCGWKMKPLYLEYFPLLSPFPSERRRSQNRASPEDGLVATTINKGHVGLVFPGRDLERQKPLIDLGLG